MTALKVVALLPAWFLLTGFAVDSPSPASTPTPPASPSPSPSPSPIPTNAYLSLDVSAGDANTSITVSGGSFLPNEQFSLDWDKNPGAVIGSAKADGAGNFAGVHVKPFTGAKPGLHQICATVPPQPCAQFELQGPPSPSPAASPTPTESPSPSPSASPTATPTPTPVPIPAANNTTGLDVLLQPPFIFLPFIAAIALLVAIAFWYVNSMRRRAPSIPDASVVHRSARPGYGLSSLSDVDIRPAPLGPTPGDTPPPPAPPAEGPDETPPITES